MTRFKAIGLATLAAVAVPIVVNDPFADQGSYFSTGVVPAVPFVPDVDQAFEPRARVVRFFERNL